MTLGFVDRTGAGISLACNYQDVTGRSFVDRVLEIGVNFFLDVVGGIERWGVDREDGVVGYRPFEADAHEPGGDGTQSSSAAFAAELRTRATP